jgi:hypothetical protein
MRRRLRGHAGAEYAEVYDGKLGIAKQDKR